MKPDINGKANDKMVEKEDLSASISIAGSKT
jgi:hypothetical protein